MKTSLSSKVRLGESLTCCDLALLCFNSNTLFYIRTAAYLERNFDSTLYPDITKLTDEPPLDVYGQEKEIPPFNMFVAGTSCKNFSMLRSKRRLDIEDKGCSGETFLAAVELLFKEKPRTAIFENVAPAPWVSLLNSFLS